MPYDIDYSKLPEHIRGGMRRYIEEGIIPGDFLQAVIKNNLVDSFGKADETNQARMFDIAGFMYNEAPIPCWNSSAKNRHVNPDDILKNWHEKGGLIGIYETEHEK
jgi:hypothetical protein